MLLCLNHFEFLLSYSLKMDVKLAEFNYLRAIVPYYFEDLRLWTFEQWPHNKPSARDMARAGFIFRGVCGTDTVECVYCWNRMHSWHSTDDPILEHRRLAPGCPVFGENLVQAPAVQLDEGISVN